LTGIIFSGSSIKESFSFLYLANSRSITLEITPRSRFKHNS
jgi:hypothetical protein